MITSCSYQNPDERRSNQKYIIEELFVYSASLACDLLTTYLRHYLRYIRVFTCKRILFSLINQINTKAKLRNNFSPTIASRTCEDPDDERQSDNQKYIINELFMPLRITARHVDSIFNQPFASGRLDWSPGSSSKSLLVGRQRASASSPRNDYFTEKPNVASERNGQRRKAY